MGLLDDLGAQVSSTWSDVTSSGVPAIIAGVENYASQQLSQNARQQAQQSQIAMQQVVSQPGPSNGVMASISKAFSDIGQNAAFKQYGPLILLSAAAFVVIGLAIKK